MVNFDEMTDQQGELLKAIADRAQKLSLIDGSKDAHTDICMDIWATHSNDVKLNINKLLEADDFNFAHDINGIRGHIDRTTGKLTKGFLPRVAA